MPMSELRTMWSPIFEETEHEPESGGQMYDLFIYIQETEVADMFTENQIIDIKERINLQIDNELWKRQTLTAWNTVNQRI